MTDSAPDPARDPAGAFQDTAVLRQGLMEGFAFDLPKITLRFNFPKRFELHFTRAVDYRAELPLFLPARIRDWSASRDSAFLSALPERRSKNLLPPIEDPSGLRHFHLALEDGQLDVLAEDFVFMRVSG